MDVQSQARLISHLICLLSIPRLWNQIMPFIIRMRDRSGMAETNKVKRLPGLEKKKVVNGFRAISSKMIKVQMKILMLSKHF